MTQTRQVYFLGIGGIGMSALARYFMAKGWEVAGYDLTPSPLTQALEHEGIHIHYSDEVSLIPEAMRHVQTLVVYTPAIPKGHSELNYFLDQGNRVIKRAECLGEVTRQGTALCVAGTHGKTTTSTLLAHLLTASGVGCNAFLGGIANNYSTNLLLAPENPLVVLEADEFDRSFHHLTPASAIITSADPDHLDIYKTPEAYRESFEHFSSLVSTGGYLVVHQSVELDLRPQQGVRLFRYSTEGEADFYATDIEQPEGRLLFRWHYPALGDKPAGSMQVELGVPLRINVDNAVASLALAYLYGAELEALAAALVSFRGVYRRFDRVQLPNGYTLIDDYAHHPVELEASIRSVRGLYPQSKILGVFQPHLYSRTADFYREFAHSLDLLDEIILLDIYPARELPMPGVSAQLIADQMQKGQATPILSREELVPHLQGRTELPPVIVMLGAGDIDRLVEPVRQLLERR